MLAAASSSAAVELQAMPVRVEVLLMRASEAMPMPVQVCRWAVAAGAKASRCASRKCTRAPYGGVGAGDVGASVRAACVGGGTQHEVGETREVTWRALMREGGRTTTFGSTRPRGGAADAELTNYPRQRAANMF